MIALTNPILPRGADPWLAEGGAPDFGVPVACGVEIEI